MKIFISHSSSDNTTLTHITNIFDMYKIEYWVDRESLYPDILNKKTEINDAINKATHFLLIWSKYSKQSTYVINEIMDALSKEHLKKFTFKLDDTEFDESCKQMDDYDYKRLNPNDINDTVKNFIFEKISKDCSFVSQIRIFKDKFKYDFENFTKLNSLNDNISINILKKSDIYNEFVSPKFKLADGVEKCDLLKHITKLLINTSAQSFIPIIGDYGSGKSSLCLFILYHLCKDTNNDKILPLYLPLNKLINYNYNDKNNLLNNIAEYISNTYKITQKDDFTKKFGSGNVVFILDGLDELTLSIDQEIINKNIENLQALSDNGNKVLLTSRKTYLSKKETKKFIEDNNLIEIIDFDQHNIDDFISKKIRNKKIRFDKPLVMKNLDRPNIKQFTSKPLFLQIICEIYPDLQNLTILNPASIFEKLTNKWINHDVEKQEISPKEKKRLMKTRQRISESLALIANGIGDKNSISLEILKNQINEEFEIENNNITFNDMDQYYKDARDSTFLTSELKEDNHNTFSFIHRSIVEYLVARRIVTCINTNEFLDKSDLILKYAQEINTNETFEFIDYITDNEWLIKPSKLKMGSKYKECHNNLDFLSNTIDGLKKRSSNKDSSKNPELGNLLKIFYSLSNFGKFRFSKNIDNYDSSKLNFSNCNLKRTSLPNAIIPKINFSNANLMNANLKGADMRDANLEGANLEGANLEGANLEGANLERTRLYYTKFKNSNLSNAKFGYAIFLETDLSNSNLSNAKFGYANVNFNYHDHTSYDARYVADLSLSLLINTDFSNANLFDALIVNPKGFSKIILNNDTNFEKAIIDNSFLIDHLSKFTDKIPDKITNSDELSALINSRDECDFSHKYIEITLLSN